MVIFGSECVHIGVGGSIDVGRFSHWDELFILGLACSCWGWAVLILLGEGSHIGGWGFIMVIYI